MIDYGAVLIVGHFVISAFNVPLGNPFYQFIPYPSMEVCEQYAQYEAVPDGYPVSIEYKLYKTAECMTKEDFQAAIAAQQQAQEPTQNWWEE